MRSNFHLHPLSEWETEKRNGTEQREEEDKIHTNSTKYINYTFTKNKGGRFVGWIAVVSGVNKKISVAKKVKRVKSGLILIWFSYFFFFFVRWKIFFKKKIKKIQIFKN